MEYGKYRMLVNFAQWTVYIVTVVHWLHITSAMRRSPVRFPAASRIFCFEIFVCTKPKMRLWWFVAVAVFNSTSWTCHNSWRFRSVTIAHAIVQSPGICHNIQIITLVAMEVVNHFKVTIDQVNEVLKFLSYF